MKKRGSLAELFRYGVTGATTTLISLSVYDIFLIIGIDYQWANLISLICSKIYGYFVNKLFVFRVHCESKRELVIEIGSFISARGITGLIDYFGLIALVELLDLNKIFAKYIIQAIVIILNYIFGKFLIFRENGQKQKKFMEAKEGKKNGI